MSAKLVNRVYTKDILDRKINKNIYNKIAIGISAITGEVIYSTDFLVDRDRIDFTRYYRQENVLRQIFTVAQIE